MSIKAKQARMTIGRKGSLIGGAAALSASAIVASGLVSTAQAQAT